MRNIHASKRVPGSNRSALASARSQAACTRSSATSRAPHSDMANRRRFGRKATSWSSTLSVLSVMLLPGFDFGGNNAQSGPFRKNSIRCRVTPRQYLIGKRPVIWKVNDAHSFSLAGPKALRPLWSPSLLHPAAFLQAMAGSSPNWPASRPPLPRTMTMAATTTAMTTARWRAAAARRRAVRGQRSFGRAAATRKRQFAARAAAAISTAPAAKAGNRPPPGSAATAITGSRLRRDRRRRHHRRAGERAYRARLHPGPARNPDVGRFGNCQAAHSARHRHRGGSRPGPYRRAQRGYRLQPLFPARRGCCRVRRQPLRRAKSGRLAARLEIYPPLAAGR